LRSFLIRSLRYFNEGTLSPFPTEAGQKLALKISGQALPRHLADSCTHHLNRSHHRPRQECGSEKLGPKLRARDRICGNAGWVIVGSPGDDARSKRSQQQSHPSNWGKCGHEQVAVCTPPANHRANPFTILHGAAVQLEHSKWSNVIRHPPWLLL
jgi:hypothetical protein